MTTFSFPRLTADRIARLALACDPGTGSIAHIGLRITPSAVRFAATTGRILASLLVPIEDLAGEPGDLVLDSGQFASALKGLAKSGGRITVEIGPKEARLTHGGSSSIARRVDGTFPLIDHVWTRPTGRRWVPTVSTLDPTLVGIAQKISGNRQPLLFVSPVEPAARLERLWAVPGTQSEDAISVAAVRAATTAPAYWADHELAVLIMPITRSPDERQLDLSQHALALLQVAAQAA
ncbi:MAG: hypothetical protein L6R48_12815 [Planctomycetes bacterium]|nr:hypothetical protein [Planctomycetota bacterium]